MDTRVIAKYKYRHEAEFAKSFLEMEGIEAMISVDDGGGAYPGALLGARIIVREEDADRATAILARQQDEGGEEGEA